MRPSRRLRTRAGIAEEALRNKKSEVPDFLFVCRISRKENPRVWCDSPFLRVMRNAAIALPDQARIGLCASSLEEDVTNRTFGRTPHTSAPSDFVPAARFMNARSIVRKNKGVHILTNLAPA
jgi:hypothetical protein